MSKLERWLTLVANPSVVAGMAVLLTGCASANVSSVRRAGTESRTYSRVMVGIAIQDLGLRREFEQEVIARSPEAFVAGTEILFPGQEYTLEEAVEEMLSAGVDAWMAVSVVDAAVQGSGTVPATASTLDGTLVVTPATAMVTATAQFQVQLADLGDGLVIWTATVNAKGAPRGVGQTNPNELVRVAARELADALVSEGLVVGPSRQ